MPDDPTVLANEDTQEPEVNCLTIFTQAEWVARWVGVDAEGGTRLLYRIGEDDRAKFDCRKTRFVEVGNGQVEMKLLRRAIWPLWRGIWRCTLEGQLEPWPLGVHLTPLRITDVQLAIQKMCIKVRKS
jgi:hypothetical protein